MYAQKGYVYFILPVIINAVCISQAPFATHPNFFMKIQRCQKVQLLVELVTNVTQNSFQYFPRHRF